MATTFTSAPEDYDGFGTTTIRVAGINRRGQSVREVETPDSAVEWQRMRYGSGLHLAASVEEFAKLVRYGFVTLAAP